MTTKRLTAAELMARLNADPDFVARRAKAEAERAERATEWSRAEQPLVSELRALGLEVGSVWDLVNIETPYPTAFPVLLAHLPRPYPAAIREGIARALATPEARFGWAEVTSLYRSETEARVKDGLAVAIAATADDEVLDQVLELVRDPRHGPSRLLLLSALERSDKPSARVALHELEADPVLKAEITFILRRRPDQLP